MKNIKLPILKHVGIMSKDLMKSTEAMTATFPALSAWEYFRNFRLYEDEMVVGEPCVLDIAVAKMDGVTYEVVAAIENMSCYQAIETQGFHHIAYVYPVEYGDEFDKEKQRLLDQGCKVVWAAHRRDGERVYYLQPKDCEIILELAHVPQTADEI